MSAIYFLDIIVPYFSRKPERRPEQQCELLRNYSSIDAVAIVHGSGSGGNENRKMRGSGTGYWEYI